LIAWHEARSLVTEFDGNRKPRPHLDWLMSAYLCGISAAAISQD
jgi:hypothetical protein